MAKIFDAPFADAGAGAVNLALTAGSGSGTFTRATTATTILSNGLIGSVASGVPRSAYSPAGVYLGYLAEGQRTNLLLHSQGFDTTWGANDGAGQTQGAIAPDGTATAWTLETAANGGGANYHQRYQIGSSATTLLVNSVWAKAGTASWMAIAFDNHVDGAAYFDLTNGVIGTVFGSITATMTPYPNGWYRCSASKTLASAAHYTVIEIHTADNQANNFNANGTETIIVWGAQQEAAAFASSYIPTTSAAVTRNADVLTYDATANISDTVGTAFAEFYQAAAIQGVIVGKSAAANTGGPLRTNTDGIGIGLADGTVNTWTTGVASFLGAITKAASTWAISAANMYKNGTAKGTGTYDGAFGGTVIGIGSSPSGSDHLFGAIKTVKIFDSALSDSEVADLPTEPGAAEAAESEVRVRSDLHWASGLRRRKREEDEEELEAALTVKRNNEAAENLLL